MKGEIRNVALFKKRIKQSFIANRIYFFQHQKNDSLYCRLRDMMLIVLYMYILYRPSENVAGWNTTKHP